MGETRTGLVLSELTPEALTPLPGGKRKLSWALVQEKVLLVTLLIKKQKKHCHPSLNRNVYFFKYAHSLDIVIKSIDDFEKVISYLVFQFPLT